MGCCPGKKSNSTPSCGTNCFRAKNHAVNCEDSVGPGGSGSKDLTEVNLSFENCVNEDGACEVTYQLVSYTAHFSVVTISEAGLVEWTLSEESEPNTLGTIRYRVFCNCNSYSATGKLFVCVKNLCANVLCLEEGYECDKTDGICKPFIEIGVS
jgi:hypothetical protein